MTNLAKSFTNTIKYWYVSLILGFLFIICGIYIFTTPLETYLTLSMLFSLSFILSGIFEISFSIANSKSLNGWGWHLVVGLLTLLMGLYLTAYPGISMSILPFIVGFTLLFRSFQLLGFSLDLKDMGIINWGNLAILSVLGILFSILLLANPIFSGISLVVLTALLFILSGVGAVMLALSLKKLKNFPNKLSAELKTKITALQDELKQGLK